MFYETQPSIIIKHPNQQNNYLSFLSMKNIIKLLSCEKATKEYAAKRSKTIVFLGASEVLKRMYYDIFSGFRDVCAFCQLIKIRNLL